MKDEAVAAPGERPATGPRFAVLTRGGPLGRDWVTWYAGSDRLHAEWLHRRLGVITDTTTEVVWFALTAVDVQAAPGHDAGEPSAADDPRYAVILQSSDAGSEPFVFSTPADLRGALVDHRRSVEVIGAPGRVALFALERVPEPPDGPATAFARAAGEWPPPRPTWR